MDHTPHAEPRPDLPGPLMRRGPRPLLLHLMLAWLRSSNSVTGLPSWNGAWPSWDLPQGPPGPAQDQDGNGKPSPDSPFSHSALARVMQQDGDMIAGIAAYRRHPSARTQADPAPIWQEGETRLLDYAPDLPGRPVLFVPSLINRGYILDLAPQHSLLRYLRRRGIRPLLLDWGWPGEAERQFTLTDYIAGRLERAIGAIGEPVILAGYCMGGLLAVAAAQRLPGQVAALALLATPWDFRADDPERSDALARLLPLLSPVLDASGTVPIDVLQSLFALLDPDAVAEKFRKFGRLDQTSPRARLFVAIEDWVNDGVPLAAQVARDCFTGWYGRNAPARGQWRVAGMPITPASLHLPCFAAVPGQDRIVPPASAWPLANALRHATIIEPRSGHVSMMVGSGAEAALWRPLADWLGTV
jgi:poly(3-hydroxyalkanoate) synthetase